MRDTSQEVGCGEVFQELVSFGRNGFVIWRTFNLVGCNNGNSPSIYSEGRTREHCLVILNYGQITRTTVNRLCLELSKNNISETSHRKKKK